MNGFIIFITESDYLQINYNFNQNNEYIEFLDILFEHFNNEDKPEFLEVNKYQIYNKFMMDSINKLTKKYKKIHQLGKLKGLLNKLKLNEYFFITNNIESNLIDKIQLDLLLKNNKLNKELYDKFNEHFDNIKRDYQIFSFVKGNLGEREINKKVCRFCNKKLPETTYHNKSHTISEALGNKRLITLDECDNCNYKFGLKIERDLVKFLNVNRVIYGIKGKGGKKVIKKDNNHLKLYHKNVILLKNDKILEFKDGVNKQTLFKNEELIVFQNIYKTFVKFFISAIPSNYIELFRDTIMWLNSSFYVQSLPKIKVFTIPTINNEPKINIYLRKEDNFIIPHAIAELFIIDKIFCLIIPFSKNDKYDFLEEDIFIGFWNNFNINQNIPNWTYLNFSSFQDTSFKHNINFHYKKKDLMYYESVKEENIEEVIQNILKKLNLDNNQ